MPSSGLYDNFKSQLAQAGINLATDALKALLVNGYTPNYGTDIHRSDVTSEVAAGGGYTTGGQALAGQNVTVTAANSWGGVWAATTPYSVGQIVRPSTGNGFVYRCVVAGTSGGTAPTWPTTVGQTVTDGGVTWVCVGTSVMKFTASNLTWASASFSATGAVLYKSVGTAGTDILICYLDFGGTKTASGGNFQITFDATSGILDLT